VTHLPGHFICLIDAFLVRLAEFSAQLRLAIQEQNFAGA